MHGLFRHFASMRSRCSAGAALPNKAPAMSAKQLGLELALILQNAMLARHAILEHEVELSALLENELLSCLPAAVGQLAAHSAYVQGAEKVAIIDSVGYRLDYVKKWIPGIHTIDFSKMQVRLALTLQVSTFPCSSKCGSLPRCWHIWTLGYLGREQGSSVKHRTPAQSEASDVQKFLMLFLGPERVQENGSSTRL